MQLRCDVHTHTLYSRHAYSTILENVHAAKEAGLELLGSTDHFSSMLYPEYENILSPKISTAIFITTKKHFLSMRE